jgi:hypothetical protein
MMTRLPARLVMRGSSIASLRAANVRSASMPVSFGATRTRSVRSGLTTSTLIGPTRVSVRSRGASREADTVNCRPSRTTLTAASMTRRFG